MHLPYTYYLFHKPTGLKYYGVRFSKTCHPSDLWNKYFTSSKKVKKLIEEYGINSFVCEIRKTFKNKQEAINWETKVLQKLNVIHKKEWINESQGRANLKCASNGMLGKYHSEETKKKMSDAQRGEKNHMFGKQHTADSIEKIRKAGIGRPMSEGNRIKFIERQTGNTIWRGRKHKPESIAKIIKKKTGFKFTEHSKQKMSLAHIGRKMSDETKKKMAASQKERWKRRKTELLEEQNRGIY